MSTSLPVGTRVRVKTPCVWPERAGCLGTVVAPPADGTYPQPGPTEVLVLLDDDPLRRVYDPYARGWSCVVRVDSLAAVPVVGSAGDTDGAT